MKRELVKSFVSLFLHVVIFSFILMAIPKVVYAVFESHLVQEKISDFVSEPGTSRYTRYLYTHEQSSDPSPPTISREMAIQDLDSFKEIIRRGYAGYHDGPAARKSWEERFDRIGETINKAGEEIPVKGFYKVLTSVCSDLNDSHFSFKVRIEGEKRLYRTMADRQVPFFSKDEFFNRNGEWVLTDSMQNIIGKLQSCNVPDKEVFIVPVVMESATDISFTWKLLIMSLERPQTFECSFMSEKGEIQSMAIEFSDSFKSNDSSGQTREKEYNSGDAIPVIKKISFAGDYVTITDSFVETAIELRNKPVFIADIRSNAGGQTGTIAEWFIRLTNEKPPTGKDYEIFSEVVLQGEINDMGNIITLPKMGFMTVIHIVDLIHSRLLLNNWESQNSHVDHFEEKEIASVYTKSNYKEFASVPYTGRMVILINNKTASAAEFFVQLARNMENTILIGENTRGSFGYFNSHSYRLPNSGIIFWAGSARTEFPNLDARQQLGHGFLPDIWFEPSWKKKIALDVHDCLMNVECSEKLVWAAMNNSQIPTGNN